MSSEQIPVVLIGCSKQFNNRALFREKITRILSHLENYRVIAVGDYHGLVRDFLGDFIDSMIPYNAKSSVIKKTILQCEYVILFWDGADIEQIVYASLLLKKKSRIIPVETTKIVNKDKGEAYDVYIGRGTPWGNPFAIGDEGMSREIVIEKYTQYFNDKFLNDEQKRKDLLSLRGKTLGCHCKPMSCHGDIIAEYLNSLEDS